MRNVLLILCDQLRADFLHAYGGPDVTPNIDRLAQSGVVFDRAYTVAPICTAARMTMLTGKSPLTCPLAIPSSVPTVADILSARGYHTAALGKMHMFPPRGPCGFKELVLSEDTGPGMFLDDYHPWLARAGLTEWPHGLDNFDLLSVVGSLPEDKTVTYWNGERVVEFLEKRAHASSPFFAVASFVKPHPPYDPPLPWANMVKPENAPALIGLDRPWAEYPEPVRLYAAAAALADCEELQVTGRIRAHYLGLVAQVDQQIGRIIDLLEETKLKQDTLILFSSDHGDFLGDHHLFMKFFAYESSARIPLILSGSGIERGRCDLPASVLDFVPTILEYCGLPAPAHCEGESLFRLSSPAEEKREGVLIATAFGHGICLATKKYKYTYWPHGEEELFDMTNDAQEEVNLAVSNPEARQKLRGSLTRELSRLERKRLAAMPPLLEQGSLPERVVAPAEFLGQKSRFVQHKKYVRQ